MCMMKSRCWDVTCQCPLQQDEPCRIDEWTQPCCYYRALSALLERSISGAQVVAQKHNLVRFGWVSEG